MIRQLAKSVREYKIPAILTSVFVSVEVILEVLIPYVISALVDFGVDKKDMSRVLFYGGILISLAIFSLLFGVLSGTFCAKASSGFAKNLRHDIFHKIQDFSFSNIDKFSTSGIITRLTTDVNFVQNSFQMLIRIAIRAPLMLTLSMVVTFILNYKMGLVFLVVCPILCLILLLILKNVHPHFKKVIKEYDNINQVTQENIRASRVVKAYVREDHEIEKFNDVSEQIYKDYSKARRILAINSPVMQFISYLCMIIISIVGAHLIVDSGGTALTTGNLSTLFIYTMQILMSLMMLSIVLAAITISRPSCDRVVELLTESPSITNCDNPIKEMKKWDIEFNNVSFSYENDISKLCLKNIELKILQGATVGILGNTGSGKSTLVSLISRLYDTTSGEILIGGIPVKNYDLYSLRENIAMVLQKNVLFSGTVADNLRWGNPNATQKELEKACRIAHASEFIDEMPDKYNTFIEQDGNNVSGGQKQRLCIARALLKKPKILILDDSTSAVDTKTDAEIRLSLKTELKHTTKIIIAQRVASVKEADIIVILDNGTISAVGTHDTLMKTCEQYKETYTSQNKKGGKKNA